MTSVLSRPRHRIPSRQVRRLMLALHRDEKRLTGIMQRELTPAFAGLGADAATAYRALKGGDSSTVIQLLNALGVLAFVDTRLKPVYARHYLRVLRRTEETLEATLRMGLMIPDPVARQVVATGGRRLGLVDVQGQTREALFRALAEGRAEGLGSQALARRIEMRVAGGRYLHPRTRALVIARTETKYAQNVSTLAGYQQSDVITGVIAYDNRLGGHGDDECVARDGQFYSFDDAQSETDNEHPQGSLSWGPAT